MAGEFIVRVRIEPGYALATLVGELGLATAPVLRERVSELLAARHPLVIDLDQLGFVDATGLGVLVGAAKRAQAAGVHLRLVCARQRTWRLLQITGLDRRLPLARTLAEARASLPPANGRRPSAARSRPPRPR